MLRWPAQRPANSADTNCGRVVRQIKIESQSNKPTIQRAKELDNDVEMDGRPVKDGDMDACNQPALPA
jgi:hypothetical protein